MKNEIYYKRNIKVYFYNLFSFCWIQIVSINFNDTLKGNVQFKNIEKYCTDLESTDLESTDIESTDLESKYIESTDIEGTDIESTYIESTEHKNTDLVK